jgi:protein-arginine kinase activator protein McsA
VIKTVVSDVPFKTPKTTKPKKVKIDLETQLEEAVLAENYELAATLRDKINKKIKK